MPNQVIQTRAFVSMTESLFSFPLEGVNSVYRLPSNLGSHEALPSPSTDPHSFHTEPHVVHTHTHTSAQTKANIPRTHTITHTDTLTHTDPLTHTDTLTHTHISHTAPPHTSDTHSQLHANQHSDTSFFSMGSWFSIFRCFTLFYIYL